MADENTPKYERESSRTVMSEHRRGASSGLVVALVLGAVAVAIALVVLFTQRREASSTSAVAQPSPSVTVPPEVRTAPVPGAPPTTTAPPSRPAVTVTATAAVSDSTLAEQIKQRILDSSELTGATIEISVSSGQVTLSGEVSNEAMRALAEQLARQVKGVKGVTNRIRVRAATATPRPTATVAVSDSTLVEQVRQKILDSSELAGATIEISASSGQVTLSGEVSNAAMRALAEQLARQVKGVKGVTNRIRIRAS